MKYLSRGLIALALVFAGCSKEAPKATKTSAKPVAKKAAPAKPAKPAKPAVKLAVGGEAANVYTTRCALCHGEGGLGDGVAAASSPVKPRTFSDAAWQAKATDDHIKKVIVEGGGAVGLSALMAANADLAGKTEVLDGLVKIIRGFKK
jgi:cytochrome c5